MNIMASDFTIAKIKIDINMSVNRLEISNNEVMFAID